MFKTPKTQKKYKVEVFYDVKIQGTNDAHGFQQIYFKYLWKEYPRLLQLFTRFHLIHICLLNGILMFHVV